MAYEDTGFIFLKIKKEIEFFQVFDFDEKNYFIVSRFIIKKLFIVL